METLDHLTREIRSFLKISARPKRKNRVTHTKFGRVVFGNPNFVARVLSGGDVTTASYDRSIKFMARWYKENGYIIEGEEND